MRCSCLVVLAVGLMTVHVSAAEPPLNLDMPIGKRNKGELPDELYVTVRDRGRPILIRTPRAVWPDQALVFRGDKRHPELRLGFRGEPDDDALSGPSAFSYRLGDGDVIPIFDELYFVEVSPGDGIRLQRITDGVAAAQRPTPGLRTITLAIETPLFWNQEARDEGAVEVMRIESSATAAEPQAVVLVYPPADERDWKSGHVLRRPKPFQATVQAGDVLSSQFQGYKVLKVVAPRSLDKGKANGGRLVGWIELDPTPIGTGKTPKPYGP